MPDKERERRYLGELRKCVAELTPGEAVESESPDFLLGSRPTRIGIEFTEYHHPPAPGERPQQEVQSLKDRVVGLAEQLHAQAGGPALYVTAIFGHHGRLSKETVRPMAKALAAAVLSQDVPRSIHDADVRVPRDLLPREIAQVHVHGSIDGEDKLWQADAGGWVARIAPSHVQREIERKQRMAGAARAMCDALWLVIVHNLVRGAPCELSEGARAAEYTHAFDRLFWLDPHTPRVIELRTHAD
jgi:hypothetical protein